MLHIVLCMLAACAAGAAWAGLAGLLKATTGTNEVISTIMLNWIALWVGVWLFGLGGPLQSKVDKSVPVSADIVAGAKLPVFWGDPELQGLHIGLFIALAALVVFWVLLNRTVTGYEVRAVGFNPDAAQASGISVGRNYVLAMAVCGLFAGLAGVARRARLAVPDRHQRRPGHPDRLPRDRGRPARAQHGGRHAVLGAAVRRAADRHVGAQPRPARCSSPSWRAR